jgi:hypothetical protein
MSAVEEDGDEIFTPIPETCHCGGAVALRDGFHKCGKCGGSYGPCDQCGGTGRLTIYDTPAYFGQLCSPIGDEPCPCSGSGERDE